MPELLFCLLGLLVLIPLLLFFRTAARAAKIPRRQAKPGGPKPDPKTGRRAAESLAALIRFETVSREGLSNFSEWVRLRDSLLHRYPLVHENMTRIIAGDYSLIYHWAAPASEKPPVLFCAHLDVVPADDRWTQPPFAGSVRDGFVWGRGALDCKHVVTCLMETAEALLTRGFVPDRDIWFAFGHDEETGGQGGGAAIAEHFARNNLRFDLILDEGAPVDPDFMGVTAALLAVAEKGMVNIRMRTEGPGGHASAPVPDGPAGRLAEAVCRLEKAPLPVRITPLILDMLSRFAPWADARTRLYVTGGRLTRRLLRRQCLRRVETAFFVRTTMAVTVVRAGVAHNVLPAAAEALLNVRLLQGDAAADVLAYLRDLTHGLDVSLETDSPLLPSRISDYDGPMFSILSESVQAAFGDIPVLPALMSEASDARRYEPFSDCVYRFCPFLLSREDRARIHGADERIAVDALGRAVGFYEDLITRLAGPQKPK